MKRALHTGPVQRGVALVVSLLLLVLVTILALSAVNTSIFEERMAGNTRDRSLAFEAAEYALREAQALLSAANPPVFLSYQTSPATYAFFVDLDTSPQGVDEETYWRQRHPWATKSAAAAKSDAVVPGQTQPRFVIEEFTALPCPGFSKKWSPPPPRNVYRITARGQGQTADAVVILQSWYDRGCG